VILHIFASENKVIWVRLSRSQLLRVPASQVEVYLNSPTLPLFWWSTHS